MTRVSHHDPDILIPCELQRSSHMLRGCNVDRVGDIIAENAGGFAGCEGIAALIGEEHLHDARRRRETKIGIWVSTTGAVLGPSRLGT